MASQTNNHAVFLTQEEARRIRRTVEDRVERCATQTGQPRQARDARTEISQATATALMADMTEAAFDLGQTTPKDDTLPALGVGLVYPPSTIPLQELEPMTIAELRMETHHRGRRLRIKRVSPIITLAARSWCIVQDEQGEETERLELCLHKSRHATEVLETGSMFVIKEPYFTLNDQQDATLRVDHPSDLVLWMEEAPTHEGSMTVVDMARRYKDEGNAALARGDLPLARAKYTEGLRVAKQDAATQHGPQIVQDLHRNRAHVNLVLNQLEEAVADGKAALTGLHDERSKDLNAKAYYRAGCAAYALGKYPEAKACFEARGKLKPDAKDTASYLGKIARRLKEQGTGLYDWKRLKIAASQGRLRLDVASFVSNTEVKESAGRGRGLFTSRNIGAGEVVMCEKAFRVLWGHESESLTAMTYDVRDHTIRVAPVGLTKAVVQSLLDNPSQIEKVMDLFGDYKGEGNSVAKAENGSVVDVFRVHDIVSRNAFGPGSAQGEDDIHRASAGLWLRAAYMNHSCVANTEKDFIGDLMIVRATRPIAAGEELFHSYDESSNYEARKAALLTTWGFECQCELCIVEKADDAVMRKKRRERVAEADAFVGREPWIDARRVAIVRAQRLARSIEETYDATRYQNLPHLGMRGISQWLAGAIKGVRD